MLLIKCRTVRDSDGDSVLPGLLPRNSSDSIMSHLKQPVAKQTAAHYSIGLDCLFWIGGSKVTLIHFVQRGGAMWCNKFCSLFFSLTLPVTAFPEPWMRWLLSIKAKQPHAQLQPSNLFQELAIQTYK